MYQTVEARPEPSQAYAKINFFARIVNVFKLMFLTIFAQSSIMDTWRTLIRTMTCYDAES